MSSSSGSIVSSTTYTSSASRLSSLSTQAAAMLLDLEFDEEIEKDVEFVRAIKTARRDPGKERVKEKVKEIEILLQEFSRRATSPAGRSFQGGGDIGVLNPWFLHVAGGASTRYPSTVDARSWTRALAKIREAIRLMASLCPADRGNYHVEAEASTVSERFQVAQFIQEAMLKLLTFVDIIVAPMGKTSLEEQYHKLCTLLSVRLALSGALAEIPWLSLHSLHLHGEIASLLSAKEGKAREAIWNMMEQTRAVLLEDGDDSTSLITPQEPSSDIHKATLSVMSYIGFICSHYWSMLPIVSEAASLGKYVPHVRDAPPLAYMIIDIASCLQLKLANKSESFVDQSLRLLFLLNNSNFIRETLGHLLNVPLALVDFTRKVKVYMKTYLQVSWAPRLSCLLNPTPPCFGENYSPLPKFESEFRKIYTTQKQWKVPDPVLRKRLRKAIADKIIPCYIKYIEDKKVTTPKFTPQELEDMLHELFEG